MARRFKTLGQIQKYIRRKESKFDGNVAAGDDNQIIYNEDGIQKGSSNLTFDEDNNLVKISGSLGVNTNTVTHAITLPDTSDASGKVKANAFVSYSSIRFKKDVQKLENAMDIINQLEGVSYKWKDTGTQDYGLIAEEVGKVLPEIVEWEDEENATSIDYIKIISFLVEAVKYQHEQMNLLHDKIDK